MSASRGEQALPDVHINRMAATGEYDESGESGEIACEEVTVVTGALLASRQVAIENYAPVPCCLAVESCAFKHVSLKVCASDFLPLSHLMIW